jgi:membrane-associated phospholipid phosphatase
VLPTRAEAVSRRSDLAVLGLGAGTLLLTLPAVASGTVGRWEERVFRAVNDLPEVLVWGLRPAQWFGVLGVPLLVAAVATAYRKPRLAVGLVLLVPLKLAVEHQVLKATVERRRPGALLDDVTARGVPLDGLAFPSGHAIIAFGVVVLVGPHLRRRWRTAVLALAVLSSVSRVYLGAHAPLDLVGGAAAGVVMGAALSLTLDARTGGKEPVRS